MIQDVAGRIGRLARRNRDGSLRPYRYSRAENRMRYVVLGVVVVCVLAGQMFLPEIIDPYLVYANVINNFLSPVSDTLLGEVVLPGLTGVALSVVTMLVVAALAFKNGRTFCNTVCPVGSALSIVSRISLYQLEIDPDTCTNCGRCEDVCKASCIDAKAHTIDYSRCVLCMNCSAACNDSAIRFTANRKRLSTPLMQQIDRKLPQMTLDQPRGNALETTLEPRRKAQSRLKALIAAASRFCGNLSSQIRRTHRSILSYATLSCRIGWHAQYLRPTRIHTVTTYHGCATGKSPCRHR